MDSRSFDPTVPVIRFLSVRRHECHTVQGNALTCTCSGVLHEVSADFEPRMRPHGFPPLASLAAKIQHVRVSDLETDLYLRTETTVERISDPQLKLRDSRS